jgi:hypothetical protein
MERPRREAVGFQSISSLLKKSLLVRLLKNAQMQGARNPEE